MCECIISLVQKANLIPPQHNVHSNGNILEEPHIVARLKRENGIK
ncbi:hypothetical protein bcere0022_9800 [Bacillus cereus Rock3-44]|nr:hypothetical protein bcere0022_9800 [Bacillus cereus Rock3-44]